MRKERTILLNGSRYLGGRYPFDALEVGQWFFVPYSRAPYSTVRDLVRERNKKDRGVYEAIDGSGGTLVTRLDPATVVLP